MPLVVTCHSCGGKFQAPENGIGKSAPCPKCRQPILICRPPDSPLEVAPPSLGTTGGLSEPHIRPAQPAQSSFAQPLTRNCPHCNTKVSIPRELVNQVVECAHCLQQFTVVESATTPSPPPSTTTTSKKKCPLCAEQIDVTAIKCKHCGSMLIPVPSTDAYSQGERRQQDRVYPSTPPKDPLLMAMLSGCCISGLGQIVLGQTIKGVMILIGMILFGVSFGILFFPVAAVFWVLAAVDAYLIANKLKRGSSVGAWECF